MSGAVCRRGRDGGRGGLRRKLRGKQDRRQRLVGGRRRGGRARRSLPVLRLEGRYAPHRERGRWWWTRECRRSSVSGCVAGWLRSGSRVRGSGAGGRGHGLQRGDDGALGQRRWSAQAEELGAQLRRFWCGELAGNVDGEPGPRPMDNGGAHGSDQRGRQVGAQTSSGRAREADGRATGPQRSAGGEGVTGGGGWGRGRRVAHSLQQASPTGALFLWHIAMAPRPAHLHPLHSCSLVARPRQSSHLPLSTALQLSSRCRRPPTRCRPPRAPSRDPAPSPTRQGLDHSLARIFIHALATTPRPSDRLPRSQSFTSTTVAKV